MASANDDICAVQRDIDKLKLSPDRTLKNDDEKEDTKVFEPHLWGFETQKLYKIALNFYKEKEGKAVHLSYEDKLKLVAFTQQVTHGKCTVENAPPLGVLDVIGRDRRLAWQNLGEISREEAMEGFIVLLDKLCPLFKTVVEAQKRDFEEKERLKREEELKRIEREESLKELEKQRRIEEEERIKQENQRRQIQEALNQQTYHQFKAYAEQQYPGNPEQQGVLIRQLQEQHYHQYMQQLHQNQLVIEEQSSDTEKKEKLSEILNDCEKNIAESTELTPLNENDSDEAEPDWPPISPAEMWTRNDVEEFKEIIRKEAGDAVIKVGHGETVTVRVPTHEDGACLFWEFATDGYDIGFGVYFEWSKPESNQVSVHISESEDEEEEEEEYETREDLENGAMNGTLKSEYSKPSTPPISVIVPVYRRDSQEEVYAGSHQYPGQVSVNGWSNTQVFIRSQIYTNEITLGQKIVAYTQQGVYLLKFDNSYSLWRSKTLYYRVYYTRPGFTNN